MTLKNYRLLIALLFLLLSPLNLSGSMDLDLLSQDYVLEKRQIIIPEFVGAYNPSIVQWRGSILMSFRILSNTKNAWHSMIGLVWLNEEFQPISKPVILDTRPNKPWNPSKSEDARLVTVNGRLYIVYNDNEEYYDEGLRRMYYSEVAYDGRNFYIFPECLHAFEGVTEKKWEKNWIPFEYHDTLLLAYSVVPHRIFLPKFGLGGCETISCSTSHFSWYWGSDRIFGGTPALRVGDQYLAFFHSSRMMSTLQSNDVRTWHYFIGGYLFNAEPPFEITHVSYVPIIGQGLYDNPLIYKRVVFPGGFIFDEQYIWLSYGREDSECWILKLDKKKLLNSLFPVDSIKYE